MSEHLALRLARREVLEEHPEALGVDAHAVAHRLELELRLDHPRVIERNVPRDELASVADRRVVAYRHHVVEPVDGDALAAHPVGDPLAGPVDEHLLVDPRRPVLADIARLAREDDRRLGVDREQHVRVSMDDHETAQVRHRALEARVLVAAHEHGVEAVACGRLANEPIPALDLVLRKIRIRRFAYCCHDCSTPFTSAQIVSFNGVGTPCSRPKRTIPPFR